MNWRYVTRGGSCAKKAVGATSISQTCNRIMMPLDPACHSPRLKAERGIGLRSSAPLPDGAGLPRIFPRAAKPQSKLLSKREYLDREWYAPSVAQASKPAVSRVSKPAGHRSRGASLPTWKSAIQQAGKPALPVRRRSRRCNVPSMEAKPLPPAMKRRGRHLCSQPGCSPQNNYVTFARGCFLSQVNA
jgi:hypothetical protein